MKKSSLLFLMAILGAILSLSAQDASTLLKPLNQRGVVRYKTIASDFSVNPVAAIGKYSDRRVTVIGRVSHLSQGQGENKVLVVTLQDAAANQSAVKGDFLSGSIPENSEIQISQDASMATLVRRDSHGNILSKNPYLTVDQIVAIKGNFKEIKAGDIILTDCKLIPKERLHELRADLKKTQS